MALAIGAIFFLFFLRNGYYAAATLELKGTATPNTKTVLDLNSRYGFNSFEQIPIILAPESSPASTDKVDSVVYTPTEVTFKENIQIPQYKIKEIALRVIDPNFKLNLTSASLILGQERVDITLDPTIQGFGPTKFLIDTKQTNWVLIGLQFLLALLVTYLIWIILRLPELLKCPDWSSTIVSIFLDQKRYQFWLIFAFISLTHLLWLLAYWPGATTNDSWSSLSDAQNIKFSDWHPYVYAIYLLWIMQFYNSIAAVVIFQILITAALASSVFHFALKQGVSKILVLPFVLLFAFSIPIGLYNLIIWKDVPFSIGILAISLWLYHLELGRKIQGLAQQIPKYIILPLSLAFIAACYFRQNGIIFLGLIPILTLTRLKSSHYLALCLSLLFSFVLIKKIIPSHFDIKSVNGSPYHQLRTALAITTHYNFYSNNRSRDIKIIENATKLKWDKIIELYPQSWFILWDSSAFVKEAKQWQPSGGETNRYNKSFILKLILQNLPIFVAARTYDFFHSIGLDDSNYGPKTNYFENPLQLHGSNLAPPGKSMYGVAIKSAPISEYLNKKLELINAYSRQYTGLFSPQVLIWNLAIYFIIYFVIIFFEKGITPTSIFILPSLISAAAIFVAGAGESWRYLYYVYLTGVLVLPLYLAAKRAERIEIAE